MKAYKESILNDNQPFPVEIFIVDNQITAIDNKSHYHDCFELLYMLKGTARHLINGQSTIVREKDLIIMNEGDIHSTHCINDAPVHILVIKFLPSFIAITYPQFVDSRYILAFLNSKNTPIYTLSSENKFENHLTGLLLSLSNEFSNKETGYEIYIKGLIFQLIALISRIGVISLIDSNISDVERIKMNQLLNYIETHFKEPIHLQMAADFLNMSYSYISRCFKKVIGSNFSEYVNFVRIREVEKLIMLHQFSISEAAYNAGFTNISSFNRIFKRMKGYSPMAMKKTNKANK